MEPRKKIGRGKTERQRTGVKQALRGGVDPMVGKATQFKPGRSGNPGGRPKDDTAAEIARAIFNGNQEQIYKAMGKALLKGNPKVFTALADRGFGKPQESVAPAYFSLPKPLPHLPRYAVKRTEAQLYRSIAARKTKEISLAGQKRVRTDPHRSTA